MNKNLTDEQIDNVLTKLVAEMAVDDSLIEEISASPANWWAVKRNIAQQRQNVSPWPPTSVWRRILSFGVPAFAAFAVVMGVLWIAGDRGSSSFVSTNDQPFSTIEDVENRMPETEEVRSANVEPVIERSSYKAKTQKVKKLVYERKGALGSLARGTGSETVSTEFIALSHAGGPESGQVVRVKVPSSMMVSLGVLTSVEKPSSLVDAEVVLGDDGQTHAIRFIR